MVRLPIRQVVRKLVLVGMLSVSFATQAEIVYLVPTPAQVPEGAFIANTPGIGATGTPAGYMVQRSQAWRMQNGNSVPSRQNYWLVMPGASASYGGYYYGNAQPVTGGERTAVTRSHVARANAYRMKLFER